VNPKPLIDAALLAAQTQADEGETPRVIHRNRSKHFVEALAHAFRDCYKSTPTARVLSKHFDLHREEFGLNELLFDVLVCDTSSVLSARDSARLTYVTKALWAVESEFARDTREAMFDFNKLVLAAADSKLFVGPLVDDEASFIEPLTYPAKTCTGDVYVALVPHPDQWASQGALAHVYKFSQSEWVPATD
jgi:hypothetical protein